MKKALKAKWLKALRSGKYKQGLGALFTPRKKQYCCLGVLAQVQGAKWKCDAPNERAIPLVAGNSVRAGGAEYLLSAFAGLTSKTQRELASLNDKGRSFKEIADYIEKKVRAT